MYVEYLILAVVRVGNVNLYGRVRSNGSDENGAKECCGRDS